MMMMMIDFLTNRIKLETKKKLKRNKRNYLVASN